MQTGETRTLEDNPHSRIPMRFDTAVPRGRVAATRCSFRCSLRRELPTLCRQYGIAEAGTFPSSREAANRYPDDFVCYLGGGLTIRDDELGADDDEDVLG